MISTPASLLIQLPRWNAKAPSVVAQFARCAAAILYLVARPGALAEDALALPLKTVTAVRELPKSVAEKRPSFEVRAVVTFVAFWGEDRVEMSVQDATAGIYVLPRKWSGPRPQYGDEVAISGRVHPGTWAPFLEADDVKVLGRGKVPTPRSTDFATLQSGTLDSQFVDVEGIVRDVQYDANVAPPSTILTLAVQGGRADVFVALQPEENWRSLLDARVRVRGVPFHYFNGRRQVFAFRVMACDSSQIEMLESPETGVIPLTPLRQLLQFDPKRPLLTHRVRVHGVVSLHWPGEFLFLQDGSDGVLVRSRQWEPLKPGDEVEVTAFAAMGQYAAQLEDARFVKTGRQSAPAPVAMSLEALPAGASDARLVQTEGELANLAETAGRAVLILGKGKLLVPVELPEPLAALPALDTGSVLSVTGVCQVDPGPQRRFARLYLPESARLLLRSVADIRVIRPAPWWNERRLATALASVGAGLLLIAGWTWSLRSRNAQLRNQMEARKRAETEVQRRRDEQSLLAADLHDSLEQTLTGVALQLQAARDQLPPNSNAPQEHLTLAERLLEHGRTGVHRAVRDLRQSSQEALDLQDELRELIRMVSAQKKVKVDLSLPESLPELPVQTRCHLLHFAQEAVTNALKHANGEQVLLQLRIEEGRASLMVSDDGRGFDPMECPGPSQGHFGLQGMRERAARMNGTLHLETKPGSGTRLTLSIPILS